MILNDEKAERQKERGLAPCTTNITLGWNLNEWEQDTSTLAQACQKLTSGKLQYLPPTDLLYVFVLIQV
jgi:hypothetical protein